MVELVSYWKAACPPLVIVKPFKLKQDQVTWWKNIYFLGLGEFFYLNGIHTDIESFMNIRSETDTELSKFSLSLDESYIVPVGGGKDSAVTLELLKGAYKVTPLIVNPRKATSECIQTAGFSQRDSIEIFRTIDPLLLELNTQGFLNGHTPFSALLAFTSLLAGVLSGKRNIALSNEASANETTVIGQNINHQYSKSFQFEKDFRDYVSAFINDDLNYFSFLRPLHEIQIACLFSKLPKYFKVFKSCNVGSKTDIWCCNCPKCLFSFIILSPFIPLKELIEIFGENLLDKPSLLPVFNQLIGVDPVKPFECIGTVEEVNMTLSMYTDKYKEELPCLLKGYTETHAYNKFRNISPEKWLNIFDDENYLKAEDFQIIKHALLC
jgi:UDP-N-acetyl-alpha-D-muramoyl-L-alanyl-L-glutamate epimerase